MTSGWREITLGEFVRLQRGHDLTADERKPGPYPVMGSAGQNGTHSEFIAPGPGVVIGRSGASIGRVHFSAENFWPHNTCLYVTDFLGNDPRFAFYLLRSLNLAKFNSGSAQPSLNRNYAYSQPVCVPPPHEQRAIADFLGALDSRIENLRQTSVTLEAIASALFKFWFLEFRCVPQRQLEPSATGVYPTGWRAFSLGELAELGRGSISPSEKPETCFAHYSLPAFDLGRMPGLELGQEIKSNKTPVPSGSVLLSKLNPHIPRVWFVGVSAGNAICSTEFLVWTPKPGVGSAFLYSVVASDSFNARMRELVTGTSNSHQRVNPDQLMKTPAVVAHEEAIRNFEETAAPLLQSSLQHRQSAKALTDIRDQILPILISGRRRVLQ